MRRILTYRGLIIAAVEVALVAAANFAAFWLRFDGAVPAWAMEVQRHTLPSLLLLRALAFVPFRLYESLWRYTGIWQLRDIVGAVACSSVCFYVLLHGVFGVARYPRSVFIIDALLAICLIGGVRLSHRFYRELGKSGGRHLPKVLVFGAADSGEAMVREMRRRGDRQPIGFIDDDASKVGQHIHGVPVLGTRRELLAIVGSYKPDELIVAIPGLDSGILRKLLQDLLPHKIRIRAVADRHELNNGQLAEGQTRDLRIEDLLTRAPVGLNRDRVRHLVAGRRILVTGAGGSIGSELCRQISALGPQSLVLYERYENSLHAIASELADVGVGGIVHPAIGDVTDSSRLDRVFREYQPDIVFHAAAHKHVPLMELNACEAVKNNVIGTRSVAEAARRHGAERFILISTDKSVRPTSIMGATKRIAELLIQSCSSHSWTSFATVRFGNVLGSNGSVVPRFLDQIKAGGPVTVTHPDMRRYFMLIPEAVHLVLHAAAIGVPRAIYVLEMGDQIKLVDMARHLIRLAAPDRDIPIVYSGIRPGEKLSEELIGEEERVTTSPIDGVLQVEPTRYVDPNILRDDLAVLERLAIAGDAAGVVQQLTRIVPDFQPAAAQAAAASGLTLAAAMSEPATDQTALPQIGCPMCHANGLRRTRTRSRLERLVRNVSERRLYECDACGWRGWWRPGSLHVDVPPARRPAAAPPDIVAIEAAVSGSRAGTHARGGIYAVDAHSSR